MTVEDTYGNVETTDSSSVAMAFGTNPGSGTLGGTTTMAAFDGVATFSNLSISAAGIGYTLAARDGTLASATSKPFDITTAAPTVTAISPAAGPMAGGSQVTITGTNLAGATKVTFGSVAVTSFVSDTAGQLVVVSPKAAAGTVNVQVTTPSGTSAAVAADKFTYVAAPTVTQLSPASGPVAGGTKVTISGTNLGTAGTATVKFGTAAAAIVTDSGSQIVVTAPAGSGAVSVTVTTPGGTATAASKFTYVAAPVATKISPTSGSAKGGTRVTITGTNLSGATAVYFGSTLAKVSSDSATSIVVTSPAGTGTVDVTVVTAGGTSATSAADKFTYTPSLVKTVVLPPPTVPPPRVRAVRRTMRPYWRF